MICFSCLSNAITTRFISIPVNLVNLKIFAPMMKVFGLKYFYLIFVVNVKIIFKNFFILAILQN